MPKVERPSKQRTVNHSELLLEVAKGRKSINETPDFDQQDTCLPGGIDHQKATALARMNCLSLGWIIPGMDHIGVDKLTCPCLEKMHQELLPIHHHTSILMS